MQVKRRTNMNNNYKTEVLERWGDTDAYREQEQKTKNYIKEKWVEANDGLMAIFAEFAACKNSGASANSAEARVLVDKLQAYITDHYYTCTNEILAGLGTIYVADERFKNNIDTYGEGTAAFASKSIAFFVRGLDNSACLNTNDKYILTMRKQCCCLGDDKNLQKDS